MRLPHKADVFSSTAPCANIGSEEDARPYAPGMGTAHTLRQAFVAWTFTHGPKDPKLPCRRLECPTPAMTDGVSWDLLLGGVLTCLCAVTCCSQPATCSAHGQGRPLQPAITSRRPWGPPA